MIKRSKSKTRYSDRKRADRVSKKRRLTMEGLEKRQLLAVGIIPNVQNVPEFTFPRNLGTVQSFQAIEDEQLLELGDNDTPNTADFIPLGTGPGQEDTIDLTGNASITGFPGDPFSFTTDIDVFSFDLRAGDILDISAHGAAGNVDVSYPDGTLWFGTDTNQGILYPSDSPMQTIGNAVGSQVVPEDGRYYLTVAPIDTSVSYTMGLRVYRPVSEQLPIGAQQVLFIDMDGASYPRNVFTDGTGLPQGGLIRIPSLRQSLPLMGIEVANDRAFNELIDKTLAEVDKQFRSIVTFGGNGDYDATGIPGQYGLTVLNSRDHADPGFHPLVTRIVVGGTNADAEQQGLLGRSSTLDVGNFSMDDIVLAVLDGVAPYATQFPIAPTISELDLYARVLATTITHEAGHSFGLRHTNGNNLVPTIMEGVGINTAPFDIGIGPDGIAGTTDDTELVFQTDQFDLNEGYFGFHQLADSLAYTLSTGTQGGMVSGRVFNDLNRDGSDFGDVGLSGVTIFSDVNGNGLADPSEPSTVTLGDGTYSLSVGPGAANVIAITPVDFAPTTPISVPTNVTLGGSASVDFGFDQVVPNITGTVFVDTDASTFRDAGERGIEDIYVYLDLDGDNRPDLGEPGANSSGSENPNGAGSYALNFPGPGTYTIRVVVPPGFEQTFPASGEHTVFFNGVSLTDNFDFGLLPSQDFGDAPDSYGTTVLAGGASHGITTGLSIGSSVDREVDGLPTLGADGDDLDGIDDEDGVRLLSPLGPGSSAAFEVSVSNTSGANAFLQAFMDFDGDGNFTDPGEHFLVDRLVTSGTVASVPVTVSVPAGATVGTTYARFRLSQTSGIGPTGFASSGEVEDYTFPILAAAEIANDDEFTVSRNSFSNNLDVLGNDFQTFDNPLIIDSLNTVGTEGSVSLSNDRKSVFYTPANGFIGRDVFAYTVSDQFGNRSTAAVVVNVSFQSNIPIALDDTFEVPEGSVNRALNVLDNDVASTFGGISITSVTAGSAGGQLSIIGGGQSLRYTPLPGFNGTEQFSYSIQDAVGSTSSATVTVNLLPGSRGDDVVDFTIGIFDPVNINTPVSNVQVGDDFLVRISVEDLRAFANPEGVASAFLDLLYTDELVATLNTDNNPNFPFDISFGPLFTGAGGLQQGNALTPGLIDEVGGVQSVLNQQPHSGPTELFTLRMRAVSPGVAVFQGDPADADVSETIVLGSDTALTPAQLRLGLAQLLILPASDNFTSAIDDSFPEGRDSDGNLITNTSPLRNRLDVLANDNLGPTGTIREFNLVTSPSLGNVFIDDNGTPGNLNDDFFSYRANANVNGLDSFTYLIVTDDNIRSTAEVTIALGNQNADSDVAFDFALVNSAGSPISSVSAGSRFGVQVFVEDLRTNPTFVFAGFLDVMYDAGIIRPSDTNQGDEFNFDVEFGPGYSSDAGVGTASRPGIIDEFGTLRTSDAPGPNPALLATIFFDAVGVGTTTVVGGPADSSPFQDTLLFQEDDPVDRSRIRFDSLQITVGGSSAALQNFSLPQDVNADGSVSPIDALLIINTMSRETLIGEGEQAGGDPIVASQYYTDVNGDRRTSAIDALQVINYLKRAADSAAVGEAVVQAPPSSSTSSSSGQTDGVWAALSEEDVAKIVSADPPANQASGGIGLVDDQDAEDEDEDVLDLLAGDVVTVWN